MKALNEKFTKIDAMSVRERIILFLLLLAGTWTAIDFLLLSPQNAAHEAEQKKLASANTTLSAAEQTLALLANQPDPNQEVLQRRDRALNALNSRLQNAANLQARMVQPKDQATILQAMLSGHSSLRLTHLETLPPEPIGAATANLAKPSEKEANKEPDTGAANSRPQSALFKHGVKLTVVGSYAALTHYLEKLESLPVGFYWKHVEMDAGAHPEISLTLILYTLSLEKTWLTV